MQFTLYIGSRVDDSEKMAARRWRRISRRRSIIWSIEAAQVLAAARWYLDAAAGWGAAFVLFNAHVPGVWSGRAGHPAFCLKWGDRTRPRRHRNWHPSACRLAHACRPDRDRRRMARATVGRGDAGLPAPTRGIPIKRALAQRRWARGTDLVGIAVLRLTDPGQKSVHKARLGDLAWSEAWDRGGRLEVLWINGLRAQPRGSKWCRLQESNPRHPVYKTGSAAAQLCQYRFENRRKPRSYR
jgi:hypothetical protein